MAEDRADLFSGWVISWSLADWNYTYTNGLTDDLRRLFTVMARPSSGPSDEGVRGAGWPGGAALA
jgi:hypothetical protein